MKRFHTHVVLVSGQQIPNVLPVIDKAIRPEEVVLCTTDDMGRNAEILEKYFARYQIRSRRMELGSAYDFAALQENFLNLASEFSGRELEIGVNLTGGTKTMAIAAQQVFGQNGFPCFYVNPEKNTILNLTKADIPEYELSEHLKINDFFAIHGYQVTSSMRKGELDEKSKELCTLLLEKHSRYGEALKTLNFLAAEAEAKKSLSVRQEIPEKSWNLLHLFQEHGAIRYYDDKEIQFADEASRRFCQGIWLEDWVGSELCKLNRQVKLQDYASSVVIESESGTKNEIDAAFLFQNRLHLIECKTAALEKEDKSAPPLYKLDSLHRLPGSFTRMILISYQPLDSYGKQRAAELRIRVVVQNQLLGLATCLEKMLKER